ncbi:formylglycine-generating enzyme family protein [Sphingomonas koreensis]|jgi:iron(II)-dependent oxidoreductase|uniref:Formylglycine-generating enzyme family protein n=1 Tax=Sphingomonas koreensis TaxID=93064 RepID=A0AAJ4V8P9_9SPHN|nr:SUMF1/EgtB/PvdO family nonheme iron enzyme [Sphingomonas koreensis]MDC7810279.1 SUMF1/EgtB/PvdO family nonheme iron enzyme [Sphingomonas koreensis]RSU17787.1 formylglycine-generating enzyme family protein [Sphingomonas koreensis]RSU20882.1 formylglycine-generating enzyme family protein [Sphingomonas koreensis]RSU23571.1 formylglycine-generating enzyme family protein [Sphingomonas koreensis]RSU31027.1 formylglycine-generating enzyme family protein [Sphingomonas koreensis]
MTDHPIRTTSDYKFSHALTGPYLPTPGKALGWPFQEMGRWRIDADGEADEWVRGLIEWRREHLIRIGFDDSLYRRPDLVWAQGNFVHALLMVEDRYFYDPDTGRYTVDRYLDDLEARFGGIDSVLPWYIYPNIGIDDRSQFDLADALPGGVEALKQVVADFHRRGVEVFLPTMPWDNGTREGDRPDWERMADLVAATGADGINGDTYSGVPRAFHVACEARGRPVILQPESTAQAGDHHLSWNLQSWTKRVPDESIPTVIKLKWLEPRHIINIENRWSRNRTNDLQHAFFNGIGYVAWENVFGFVNLITDRDAETLRRVAMVQRRFAPLFVSKDWRPYERTLQFGIFASRFPGEGRTLWTLINRSEFAVTGEQLKVPHVAGTRYYDVWNGTELSPRIEGDRAIIALAIDGRGFGAVLAASGEEPGLAEFLKAMADRAATPLSSFSSAWAAAQQELVEIEATAPHGAAPEGMIAIPAAEFDFKVRGVVIEGYATAGVDIQYPWEPDPRRTHRHRVNIPAFAIDRFPVTNAEFKRFLDASGYAPRDAQNFLVHWIDGAPPAGWENKPVTWIGIEDARAYAAWAGKRLCREWEWQYAAQGDDGRLYPWGNDWNPDAVPEPCLDRTMPVPADVDGHPAGASPFGVMDLVGNVWEWTDEYRDRHVRGAVLRGGSAYQPQTSHWYFPQAYRLDEHGKYLLMAPSKDRSAGIGFRCAVDL